ncbi:hypothetical protein BC831DRAFT_448653 [Entophlyctis helioformis]|nr:hypothetical protein BC831DRAFT_448653 [Entophlyctis helioformis]
MCICLPVCLSACLVACLSVCSGHGHELVPCDSRACARCTPPDRSGLQGCRGRRQSMAHRRRLVREGVALVTLAPVAGQCDPPPSSCLPPVHRCWHRSRCAWCTGSRRPIQPHCKFSWRSLLCCVHSSLPRWRQANTQMALWTLLGSTCWQYRPLWYL